MIENKIQYNIERGNLLYSDLFSFHGIKIDIYISVLCTQCVVCEYNTEYIHKIIHYFTHIQEGRVKVETKKVRGYLYSALKEGSIITERNNEPFVIKWSRFNLSTKLLRFGHRIRIYIYINIKKIKK